MSRASLLLSLFLATLHASPCLGYGGADIGNGRVPEPRRSERTRPVPVPSPEPTPTLPSPTIPPPADGDGAGSGSVLSLEASARELRSGERVQVRALVVTRSPSDFSGCGGAISSPALAFTTLYFDECRVSLAGKNLLELDLSFEFPRTSVARPYQVSRLWIGGDRTKTTDLALPTPPLTFSFVSQDVPLGMRLHQATLITSSGLGEARLGETVILRALVEAPEQILGAALELALDQGFGPERGSLQFAGNPGLLSQNPWWASYSDQAEGSLRRVEFGFKVPETYEAADSITIRELLLLDGVIQETRIRLPRPVKLKLLKE